MKNKHGGWRLRNNMIIADANVILRYMLNDNKEMAEHASNRLSKLPAAITSVTTEALAASSSLNVMPVS
jgi:predicted nucleic acid-binding protein